MKEKIMNMVIDHLKKSPVLQSAKSAVETALDHINDNLRFEPLELSALAERLSPATDQLILETEQSERAQYVGGRLSAIYSKDSGDDFVLLLKLYFKGGGERIFVKEVSKTLPAFLLATASLAELNAKGEISYEVDPPAKGGA